jgi:hypothetical protein
MTLLRPGNKMGVDEILISTLAYLMKKFSGLSVNATHGATFNNFQLILPHRNQDGEFLN